MFFEFLVTGHMLSYYRKKVNIKTESASPAKGDTKGDNSVAEDRVIPPASNPMIQASEEEGRVDDPEAEEEDAAMPVPQVKIGPDGSLIINEER